ncbi:MAG: MFS transporter [Bacillota bacterium]
MGNYQAVRGTGSRRGTDTRRNVPVMAITTAFNIGSMTLWSPVLSLIMRDLGATDFQISLAAAVWAAGSALVQYQGGRWGDRFGRFPIIVYPTYLCGLAIGTAALMRSWIPFAFVLIFWNAFNAVQAPVFSPFVGESVPPAERGRAFGRLEMAIGFGVVIGPLLGARLLPVIGARGLLLTTAVVLMVTGAARHLFLRETKPETTGSRPFAFSHVLTGRLRLVLLSTILYNVILSMTLWGPFLPLHASDAMRLSKPTIQLFYALGAATAALASPLAGRAVGRFGSYKVLAVAGVGLGVASLLWSVQRGLPGIAGGYLLMALAFQYVIVASDTFRVHAVDDAIRGVALGAIGTVTSLSTVVVVPLAGYLKAAWPAAPFFIAAAAGLGLVAATAALARADAGGQAPGLTEPAH